MKNQDVNLATAITLSRMYGVAETLNPFPCKPHDEFYQMICSWTAEFTESDETDLVKFFECKLSML